jgi:hypothetical protein
MGIVWKFELVCSPRLMLVVKPFDATERLYQDLRFLPSLCFLRMRRNVKH